MEPISVRDILGAPQAFDGKHVRVHGLYMRFHENQCLNGYLAEYDDLGADDDAVWDIWLDTDERTKWMNVPREYGRYSQAIVGGVYRHGDCGHLGRYPGQLTNISSVSANINCARMPKLARQSAQISFPN
jgi:hypothetical protein